MKIPAAIVDGALKGIIGYLMGRFPPTYIEILIDHKYTPIAAGYYIAHGLALNYAREQRLTQEDVVKMEKFRNSLLLNKTIIPMLENARQQAKKIPPELIVEKINVEWLKRKGMERCPQVVEIIESKGKAGEEWLNLVCMELVLYLTGRLNWDNSLKRMVASE